MGSGASKQVNTDEGIHLTNSTVPIHFAESFISKLEDSTSADTSAERQQSFEALVQSRVAEELQRLRDVEAETLAQTAYEISKQNIETEKKSDLNSVIMDADVQELKKKLNRQLSAEGLSSKTVQQRESAVIACLRKNADRSLDCKKDVEEFKASVRDLQAQFINRYQ